MKERLFNKINGCFNMIEVIKKEDSSLPEKIGKIDAQMGFIFGYFEQWSKQHTGVKCDKEI